MKKVVIVIFVLIALLLGAMVAVPFIFKDKLVAMAKDAANEQLDATVDFGDFDLSLFRSFPNLSFQIESVTVDGKSTYQGVRLAEIGSLEFTIQLLPLLSSKVVINEMGVRKANFDVRINREGLANYDIMKSDESDSEETDSDTTSSEFNVELKRYFLKEVNLKYYDSPAHIDVVLEDLNHSGSGDFTQDLFVLSTKTQIGALTVNYEGLNYMNKVVIDAETDLEMDMKASKYTIKKNEMKMNHLDLGLEGWVAMPDDPIDMDIKFYAKEAEFKHFLSMIPADFARDIEDVSAAGTMAFSGFAKGTYSEVDYPGFGIDFSVNDGRFKFPDLPESAENIQIACNISHPGGNLDNVVVDLSKFHVEFAKNPINMRFLVKTLITDPDLDAAISANLDLASINKVVPMEEQLSGNLKADVTFKGRFSAIEAEQYDKFDAAGSVDLSSFTYRDGDSETVIDRANLSFTPEYAALTQFDMRMDETQISAQGQLENYLPYFLQDGVLRGSLAVQSPKINLNDFMDDEEVQTESAETETPVEESLAFEIPANLDLQMTAAISELIYDDLTLGDVKGLMTVKDQRVSLKDGSFKALQGLVALNGYYDAKNPNKPVANMTIDAKDLDINQTATTFIAVEQFMPLAKKATGGFSTKFSFESELDSALNPILESVAAKGHVQTKDVYIKGFEPINKLAQVLKIDRLKEQNIKDAKFKFQIVNGRAHVEPFDVNIDQIKTNISGSTGLDQTIDYVMKLNVPTDMLKGGAMDLVQGLAGQAAAFLGQEFKMGDKIEMDVLVGGTVEKPTFKPSIAGMGDAGKNVVDMAKDKIKEELQQAKDDAVEKAVQAAQEQADKMIAEANKQADKLRAEAKKQGDKLRSEGRSAAKKLEDEASNPIAKVAAKEAGKKVIKEADNAADKVEAEADKQARKLIDEAKASGDRLIEGARAKVD